MKSPEAACGDCSYWKLPCRGPDTCLVVAAALTERLYQGEGKRQAKPFINSPFEHSQRRGVSQQGREAPADGAIRCQHVPHTGLKLLSSMVGRPSHAVVAYSMDGSQTARREDDHLRGGQGEGIFLGKPISTSSEDVIH